MLERYYSGTTDAVRPMHIGRWGKRPYRERLVERFWKYVDKSPGQGPKGECWEWRGSKTGVNRDYGQIAVKLADGSHRPVHASVLSYEIHHGNVPKGLLVCHHCDNPPCVRGEHLWVGTDQDNNDDAQRKGRKPTASPHERIPFAIIKTSFAREIRRRRLGLGISLRDVEESAGGIHYSYVSYIERGKRLKLKEEDLVNICLALNFPLDRGDKRVRFGVSFNPSNTAIN